MIPSSPLLSSKFCLLNVKHIIYLSRSDTNFVFLSRNHGLLQVTSSLSLKPLPQVTLTRCWGCCNSQKCPQVLHCFNRSLFIFHSFISEISDLFSHIAPEIRQYSHSLRFQHLHWIFLDLINIRSPIICE